MSKIIGKWVTIEGEQYQYLEDITHSASLIIRYYARNKAHSKDEASHIIELIDGNINLIKL
jgi:hypothetical protein